MKTIPIPIAPPKTLEEALIIIELLCKKIAELEERLNKNSKNSSKPPSQDQKKQKSKMKKQVEVVVPKQAIKVSFER